MNAIQPKASGYPYDVEKDSDSPGIVVRFERANRLDQVEFMKKKKREERICAPQVVIQHRSVLLIFVFTQCRETYSGMLVTTPTYKSKQLRINFN